MPKLSYSMCAPLLLMGMVSAIAWSCSCTGSDTTPLTSDGKIGCSVSILPQKYLVERIGGKYVNVDVMVGPGQSPATYEPTGRQLTGLSKAALYFSVGVEFEKTLVPRIERNFENVSIVDTSVGIERRRITGHSHFEGVGTSGEGDSARQTLNDPHIWLAPHLAARMAENICQGLCERDPEHTPFYRRNCDTLISELLETDGRVREILSGCTGREIYVFHPAYGYFTDAYGLIQIPIEMHGGTPGPRYLAGVIERAETHSVTTIFVQPQFSSSSAKTIANTIGAKIVILDPLAEDCINNSIEMASRISAALNTTTASE